MSDTTKSDRSQPTVHRRWTVDQLPPTTDSAQASRHRLFNGPTLIAHAQAGPHSLTSGFDHALSDEPIDGDAIVVLLDDDASPGRTDGIKAPPGTNGRQTRERAPGRTMRRSVRDDILVDVLARGGTQRAAAAAAGVTDRTVRRRQADPEFQRQVRRRRDELFSRAADRAVALMPLVFAALERALEPQVDLRTQVSACRTGAQIVHSFKALDVSDRLSALEAAASERATDTPSN